jgi:hypothetical protein
MRSWMLLIGAALMISLSGCEAMRGVEQWKCDNLGLCCFGIRPSCQQGCPSACGPMIIGSDPCCPCEPAGVPVMSAPCQSGACGIPAQ